MRVGVLLALLVLLVLAFAFATTINIATTVGAAELVSLVLSTLATLPPLLRIIDRAYFCLPASCVKPYSHVITFADEP
jgi:hypothetical protein